MPKTTTKTHIYKKQMLEALEKSLGVVSTASKKVGIDRKRHYEWLKNDEEYAASVKDIKDVAIDFAESQLHKQMSGGNTTATIFFLKTQGKERGYVERSEVDLDVQGSLNLQVEFIE